MKGHKRPLVIDMKHEEQRVAFINSTMKILHDECDELYEAMMDREYSEASAVASSICENLEELKKTLENE